MAYALLGVLLIWILREGASFFGIQKFIGKYGECILGPALLLIGLFMLLGNRFKLPSFGFNATARGWHARAVVGLSCSAYSISAC